MFTIGDFARHGRVSVRMLRHYDETGLLRPARVDPASYRFYEASQLARLNRIIALKDLGFTLEQVRDAGPDGQPRATPRIWARLLDEVYAFLRVGAQPRMARTSCCTGRRAARRSRRAGSGTVPAAQIATAVHRGPNDGLEAARIAVHARLVVTDVPSIVWAVVSSLWVARLLVSDATAQKLSAKHGLDWQEVHDAIVCIRELRFTWQHHPERGRRAMVELVVQDQRCIAVLYPVSGPSGDVFALGSASRTQEGHHGRYEGRRGWALLRGGRRPGRGLRDIRRCREGPDGARWRTPSPSMA